MNILSGIVPRYIRRLKPMIKNKIHGKEVSLLGFGLMRLPRVGDKASAIDYEASSKLVDHALENGVNYFDMAYTYTGSEEFAGRAFAKHPRDSYYLATKCPPWKVNCADDFDRIFEEQLRRCKTDYFDFYLIHNFAQELMRAADNKSAFAKFEKVRFHDMLMRKKAEGKIRAVGFSFHGTLDLLEMFIGKYEVDFGQIQLNYVDWNTTNAKRQYEILTERGIPIVIMEPLRGGALAELSKESAKLLKDADSSASIASWGMRYAASLPGVVTILSGMSTMEQLKDNIVTISNLSPVTEQEKSLLYKAAEVYRESGVVPCTGCEYCLPCPLGVSIPKIFSIYSHALLMGYRIPFDNGYATLPDSEKASACTGCGKCAQKCPQHLDVPGLMSEIDKFSRLTD